MAEMLKLRGVQTLFARLKNRATGFNRRMTNGLKLGGTYLLSLSQGELVPICFGFLKISGYCYVDRPNSSKVRVIVGYSESYAIYVHENQEAAHGAEFNIKHAAEIANAHTPAQKRVWFERGPNEQYKFLEKPMREHRQEILALIRMGAKK